MFLKALRFRFVGALQIMWLQKLHFELKIQHLCSEFVVLIEIWSPPLLVLTLSLSGFAIWLSLTRIVRAEFLGCMKDVFRHFLTMKVVGTVFVFSLALNRMVNTSRNLLLLVVSI